MATNPIFGDLVGRRYSIAINVFREAVGVDISGYFSSHLVSHSKDPLDQVIKKWSF